MRSADWSWRKTTAFHTHTMSTRGNISNAKGTISTISPYGLEYPLWNCWPPGKHLTRFWLGACCPNFKGYPFFIKNFFRRDISDLFSLIHSFIREFIHSWIHSFSHSYIHIYSIFGNVYPMLHQMLYVVYCTRSYAIYLKMAYLFIIYTKIAIINRVPYPEIVKTMQSPAARPQCPKCT